MTDAITDLLHDGAALHRTGALDAAADRYRTVLRQAPDMADAWHLLGLVHCQNGDVTAGIDMIRHALRLQPGLVDARVNLGRVFERTGDHAAAQQQYGEALAIHPMHADAAVRLGGLLTRQGRHAESITVLTRAQTADAGNLRILTALGNAHLAAGVADQAVPYLQAVADSTPHAALAHTNLGNALRCAGRLSDAVVAHRQALAIDPNLVVAHGNLAVCLQDHGDSVTAITHFERALAQAGPDGWMADGTPDCSPVTTTSWLSDLVFLLLCCCDWTRLRLWAPRLLTCLRSNKGLGIKPYVVLLLESATRSDLLRAARLQARGLATVAPRAPAPPAALAMADTNPLTVAYLSADFHEHPTAVLTAELFERHDRELFRIIALSSGPDDGSALRRRIAAATDRFVDIAERTDGDADRIIRDLGIHILVDLKGHTTNARLDLLARRPAPVQVHYLAYAGPVGRPLVDYYLADPILAPANEDDRFDEAVIRLPVSYQVNDRQRAVATVADNRFTHGLPETGFVFCCFNNVTKIAPTVFAIWMRLLQRLPHSVLWLLAANPLAHANLRSAAVAAGVDPDRLVFAARRSAPTYRALFRHADLFLDTLPYNAHTTASDALWAGLPVLTCAGQTLPGRVAASLCTAAGLTPFIVPDLTAYETMALTLAQTPERLAAFRQKLNASRHELALFDAERFTRHLETAFQLMWMVHCAGDAPAAFCVVPRTTPDERHDR